MAAATSTKLPPVAAILKVSADRREQIRTVQLMKRGAACQYLRHAKVTGYYALYKRLPRQLRVDSFNKTHRHRLIGTSSLHLVIGALALLASSALERVRLGL